MNAVRNLFAQIIMVIDEKWVVTEKKATSNGINETKQYAFTQIQGMILLKNLWYWSR